MDKKRLIKTAIAVLTGILITFGGFVSISAFKGYDHTIVKRDFILENYYNKIESNERFADKIKTEIQIRRYEEIINMISDQNKRIDALIMHYGINFDLKESCPYPPCKKKKGKRAVAKTDEEEDVTTTR